MEDYVDRAKHLKELPLIELFHNISECLVKLQQFLRKIDQLKPLFESIQDNMKMSIERIIEDAEIREAEQ